MFRKLFHNFTEYRHEYSLRDQEMHSRDFYSQPEILNLNISSQTESLDLASG